jgi:hypothetical protein
VREPQVRSLAPIRPSAGLEDAAVYPLRATPLVLARAETCHVLRHPAHAAGAVGSGIVLALGGVAAGIDFSTLVLSGFGCLPLGIGTFVAMNLISRRDIRSGTEELLETLPETSRTRTLAQLLAVAVAVFVAIAAVVLTAVVVVALGGPEVRFTTGVERRIPTAPELAQGPLAVAVLGITGIAVGRLVPTALVAPVLAVVLLASTVPEGALRWFGPIVNPAGTVPGGYWPHPEIAPRTELVALDVESVAWHLLYLVGVAGVAAAGAVGRHRITPSVLIAGVAALALAVSGGVLQLR